LLFRAERPDYELWCDFRYEYEAGRLAIDLIDGSELLRQWIDDPAATAADLEALAGPDEAAWRGARKRPQFLHPRPLFVIPTGAAFFCGEVEGSTRSDFVRNSRLIV